MNTFNNLELLIELDALGLLGGREDVLSGVFADVTNYDGQRQHNGRAIKLLAGRMNPAGQFCNIVASIETIASNDNRLRAVWTSENTATGLVSLLTGEVNLKTQLAGMNKKPFITVTGDLELTLEDGLKPLAEALAYLLPVALESPASAKSVSQPMQHAFGIVREVHEARFWNGGLIQGKAKQILG